MSVIETFSTRDACSLLNETFVTLGTLRGIRGSLYAGLWGIKTNILSQNIEIERKNPHPRIHSFVLLRR